MSILIKNMTMPKSCTLCELLKNDRNAFYCPLQSKEANLKANLLIELYVNCPLVELSSHGRLIGRDALTLFGQIATRDVPTIIEAEKKEAE